MVSVLVSVFRLCVPQFTLCPRGRREMSGMDFVILFHLPPLPY